MFLLYRKKSCPIINKINEERENINKKYIFLKQQKT